MSAPSYAWGKDCDSVAAGQPARPGDWDGRPRCASMEHRRHVRMQHQRCGYKPAQGRGGGGDSRWMVDGRASALGEREKMNPALKGRQNVFRPFRAWAIIQSGPRALPWAGLWAGLWPSRPRMVPIHTIDSNRGAEIAK